MLTNFSIQDLQNEIAARKAAEQPKRPENLSYFYLRLLAEDGESSHPFVCVALMKELHMGKKDMYRVSYYVHNPKHGPFVKAAARAIAIERLNSELKSQVISKDKLLAEVTARDCGDNFLWNTIFRLYGFSFDVDVARNERAAKGGFLELEPREEKAQTASAK